MEYTAKIWSSGRNARKQWGGGLYLNAPGPSDLADTVSLNSLTTATEVTTAKDTSTVEVTAIQPLRLGVVTPFGNERAGIEAFIDQVLAHLKPYDRWYCVLDNIAKDGTREFVENRSKTDERVIYIWAPQSRCIVDAYFAGYEAAYRAGCNWILEMDAGFSHPPAKIPEFIAAMEANYDFACGSRFMTGGAHRSPWARRCLSYGGTLLAQTILGSKMTDMTSGFECFSRRAMECVLKYRVHSHANFFQTEIRHMMHRFRWKEIPFVYVNDSSRVGRRAIGESLRIIVRIALQK